MKMSPSTAATVLQLDADRHGWCPLTRAADRHVLRNDAALSTCAPSLIWRSGSRNSPSILPRPACWTFAFDVADDRHVEPMQEAIPAFVVGSDFAHGLVMLPPLAAMTSAALTGAFLSVSGTPLFCWSTMSTSLFPLGTRVRCANRTEFFDAAPTYHLLSGRGPQ